MNKHNSFISNILFVLAGVFVFFLFSFDAFSQQFVINNFDAQLLVKADGTLEVTETIDVTFRYQRHGIFRSVPYLYETDTGDEHRTPYSVLSVTKPDGSEWNYDVSKEGNTFRIKIGDPDIFVLGRQTYIIKYSVENVILFFDDHDELYWNVTGDEWEANIEQASAVVTLETDQDSCGIRLSCYTGRKGSTESLCQSSIADNTAHFETETVLTSGQGFTIAAGWNKGIIQSPTGMQRFWWALDLRRNWIFLLPLVLTIIFFVKWFRRGRDPRSDDPIVVQYEPPQVNGIYVTPTQCGIILDHHLDPRDISASIISLAVKGYLRIEETGAKKEYRLVRTGQTFTGKSNKKSYQSGGALSDGESALLDALFSIHPKEVTTAELKNKLYKKMPHIQNIFYDEVVKLKMYVERPDTTSSLFYVAAVFIFFGGFFSGLIFAQDYFFRWFFAIALSSLSAVLFGYFMPARTKAGAQTRTAIQGFEEFMMRVDKQWLDQYGTKEIFYEFLPYAIALNVTKEWAKAFEGIYDSPPEWYSGTRYGTFGILAFTSHVSDVGSSIREAAYTAPRSSGSGSGSSGFSSGSGSSGGGFGGGGGGSW